MPKPNPFAKFNKNKKSKSSKDKKSNEKSLPPWLKGKKGK